MTNRILAHWPWAVGTILLALVVHLATVILLPGFIMNRTLAALTRSGGYNMLHHQARATSESHGVVRPSPDLLYSTCPYDLSHGPLLVRARVPTGTYWSVSAFDANTDNFFVRNDLQARNGEVAFIIFPPPYPDDRPYPHDVQQVWSPTLRGLVLFRTLINNEADLAEIDSARRQASCQTYRPGP
jgi:uncharacterized membrane protein